MEEIKNENIAEAEAAEVGTEPKEAKEKKPRGKEKELLQKIEELEKSLGEKDDKYLRLAAEYDNFRRRSREEKDRVYEEAMSDTVGELLPIIDNLERAAAYSADSSVADGIVMIFKSVEAVFSKLGIESYGAKGDKFDPEKGLALAISKRVLGNNYIWHGRFMKWLPKAKKGEKK